MGFLEDTFGRPSFAPGGSQPQPTGDTFPAQDKTLLVVLSLQNKVTPTAIAALSRTFTLAEANQLYEDDDIVDEQTYSLLTGRQPPAPKLSVMYGAWRDAPALPGAAAPGQMTWQEISLGPSESFSVVNDYRGAFEVEWRIKLPSDAEGWPLAARGEREIYAVIPPDSITVSTVSEKKRTYSATAKLVRRFDAALVNYNPGELEYRYVLRLAKRGGL